MNIPAPENQPPDSCDSSLQLDLFQWFIANSGDEVSNTVEFWDSIPRYFFTPALMAKLRTESGHADPYEWQFEYQGKPCEVRIQPALIKQKDGRYLAFFPGVTEELVEEALKKILSDQQYGLHEVEKVRSWVRFTLRMIQRELKDKGKSRSIDEIKHAIEVMASCVVILIVDGKEIWRGALLQDLVTVGREEYLADSEAHHAARLPLFVSEAINRLDYRQFNYRRLMSCKDQLARWIYRRLISRYKHAGFGNDYHFLYSSLKSSGLLQQKRAADNRVKVLAALDDLKRNDVIRSYVTEPTRQGKRIVEMKYIIEPSRAFISEQKAANKRHSEIVQRASQAKLPTPCG